MKIVAVGVELEPSELGRRFLVTTEANQPSFTLLNPHPPLLEATLSGTTESTRCPLVTDTDLIVFVRLLYADLIYPYAILRIEHDSCQLFSLQNRIG